MSNWSTQGILKSMDLAPTMVELEQHAKEFGILSSKHGCVPRMVRGDLLPDTHMLHTAVKSYRVEAISLEAESQRQASNF